MIVFNRLTMTKELPIGIFLVLLSAPEVYKGIKMYMAERSSEVLDYSQEPLFIIGVATLIMGIISIVVGAI